MKINKVTYYDHKLEWRFEPIEFSNLTLLVGATGVGKTQILRAIMNLSRIANGSSLNGIKWDVIFTVKNFRYSNPILVIKIINRQDAKSAKKRQRREFYK